MAYYPREIPRDLFNESKLLKCLGELILQIGQHPVVSEVLTYEFSKDNESHWTGFNIQQDPSDGSIFVNNIKFWCQKKRVIFYHPLNSRGAYPLICQTTDDREAKVFTEVNNFSEEFLELIGANRCPCGAVLQTHSICEDCWNADKYNK